jgi:hypothetical protein
MTLTVHDFRRKNLRDYIDNNGGPTTVAKQLGYSSASFIVQMTGPTPTRVISEQSARQYEQALSLPSMALDAPADITDIPLIVHNTKKGRPATHVSTPAPSQEYARLTRILDTVCDTARLNNSTIDAKFMFIVRNAILQEKAENRPIEPADLQSIFDLLKTS